MPAPLPTAAVQTDASRLARTLVLDELFDLSLYRALREIFPDEQDMQRTLSELIEVETRHLAFWQTFFQLPLHHLDVGRRIKLQAVKLVCRWFGTTAVHLVLEAIEVHGVRKYLTLWKSYHGQPIGKALEGILVDEFQHEDVLVTKLTERKINAAKIRNIFLGLNDGLVEILGAVSGFFGAFGSSVAVLVAALTTAVAGALSMGAGAFLALSSEQEIQSTESLKKQFLGETAAGGAVDEHPLPSAVMVGCSYLLGALVPVLPILVGSRDAVPSIIMAGIAMVLVSALLAFLSGMQVRRRIALNVVIMAIAVSVSYGIGLLAKKLWGVAI